MSVSVCQYCPWRRRGAGTRTAGGGGPGLLTGAVDAGDVGAGFELGAEAVTEVGAAGADGGDGAGREGLLEEDLRSAVVGLDHELDLVAGGVGVGLVEGDLHVVRGGAAAACGSEDQCREEDDERSHILLIMRDGPGTTAVAAQAVRGAWSKLWNP